MNYKRSFIIISFIFLFIESFSQHPKMLQYTIEDGIPGSEVFDVVQDERGYIWLATNNGISKFNGKKFVSYYTRDGLPDNSVIEFYKDSKSKIWILTYKNKLAYLENDSIYQYKYNYKLKDYEWDSNYCFESFVVKKDNIYIGWKAKGIIKIDTFGIIDTVRYFSEPSSVIYKLSGDELIYSHYKPYEINYNTHVQMEDTGYYFQPFKKSNITRNARLEYAYFNEIISASFGKHLFIIKDSEIQLNKIFQSDITKLKYDRKGNLWVCTFNNGIFFYPNSDISIKAKFNLLKGKTITSIYQDNESGYWISTMNSGIFYLPSLKFLVINKEDGLKENYVNNLAEGDNELWYTTINNSLGYINDDKIIQFDLSKINSYKISHIYFDKSENKLWGSFEEGINSLFYSSRNSFKSYRNDEINYYNKKTYKKNSRLNISYFIKDDEVFLIGNSKGLKIFNNERFKENINKAYLISVHTMDFGKTTNEVWIGNRDGLYLFKNDSLKYFGKKKKIFQKRVIKLKYDKNTNQLWVATKDSGIYVLKNDIVKSITINDGLSGNNITALCVKNNRVWVGTTMGLDQISFSDTEKFIYKIQHFNENKGLVSNFISDIEVIEPYVYIATNKGISFFNYEKVKKNNFPPPIFVTNIKINNIDTIVKNEYILSHDKNIIEIEFNGLGYHALKSITYKYKLEGLHKTWQTTSSNNIGFTTLPTGQYTFIIYAVNEDGVLSSKPAEIHFKINSPFYLTWWFIIINALFIVFVTGIIFGIINKVKVNEIRKRSGVEKDLLKERQKALGHQINPHFIFNTLSSIQYYLYKKDKISSSIYLEKFSKFMRSTLYTSQNEFISINDELNSLTTYLELEQLRFDEKFKFSFSIDKKIDIYLSKIPAFLIQPYLENSIWHGINQKKEKGLITIDMKLEEDYIICTIEDNGIGRKASIEINKRKLKSHISLGGEISNKRMKLINLLYKKNLSVKYFDLKDDKENALGTKVELRIPIFYE